MNIGIRLHDAAGATIQEKLANAADQGFGCAHIALAMCYPNYKMTVKELTPGFAMEVKKACAKENLDVAVLGCYLNLANPCAEELKATQEVYKAHLRFASLLGAGVVGTETGAPNREYRFEEACHTEKALDQFLYGLEPVVKYAESVGQVIALEPVYRHIMWNPKQTRKVLDSIASPNLQVIFDPVNLLHESNYEKRDEIFAEAMDLLCDEIAVLHIKDFDIVDGKLVSMGAGLGIMNESYDPILKFAREKKPYIHATLEDTKPDNAKKCLEYIKARQ